MYKFEIEGTGTKNILVLTGVHGNEYTPIHCGKLLTDYHYNDLRSKFKKLTVLNAINTNGIRDDVREVPTESVDDLNRMFKVDADPDLKAELIAYFADSDVVIDIHSSPNCTEMLLFNQDQRTNSYVEFAEMYKIPYLIRYSSANTIKKYCNDCGKIAFTLELNQMHAIDLRSADVGFNIVVKIVKFIERFHARESEPSHPTYVDFFTYKSGLFMPAIRLADVVCPGALLGNILDLQTLKYSPVYYTGVPAQVMCFGENPYVSASHCICSLQPI